jgi:hypothetical protein
MNNNGRLEMPKKTQFIAETDETGKVVWLWRRNFNDRVARPVGCLEGLEPELQKSNVEGSSVEAALGWLVRKNVKKFALAGIDVNAKF